MIVPAFLLACGFLAIGCLLRIQLRVLQILFVPASVVAGAVGLGLFQAAHWFRASSGEQVSPTFKSALEQLTLIREELGSWPGWLIAVVFAALLLESPSRSFRESARQASREGLVVWIIVLGQTTLGLWITWLVLQPLYNVPSAFGMLIETGFAGGHGTAAAMGEVFAKMDIPYGKDLGMMMATVGLVASVTTGIVYINIAVRRGLIRATEVKVQMSSPGLEYRQSPPPIAFGRVRAEVMEPMVLQVIFLAAAFAIGLGLQSAVNMASVRLGWDQILGTFPLFIYTLFGGLLTRRTADILGITHLIDTLSLQRLVGTAMEFLVVAAIASLNLPAVVEYAAPLSILVVAALAWTAFCLFFLSRWLLPNDYWFELGLLNYGMSTGTTATGFVLLRVVDKQLTSGAAEDYALAAPLSSPFIGGGMVTVGLPVLVLQEYPLPVPCLALLAIMVALFVIAKSIRWDEAK